MIGLAAPGAWGDRIEYKDGRVLSGIILRHSDEAISIYDGLGTITVPASAILRVIEESEAEDRLIEAGGRLSAGRAAEGIALLGQAAREGVNPESLAAVMFRHGPAILATIPRLPASVKPDWAEALARIDGVELPRQADFMMARLEWHLQSGDLATAGRLLEEIEARHPAMLDERRERLTRTLDALIETALEEQRFSEALDLVIELRRLDADHAGSKRIEYALLVARRLRDQARYEEALRVYADQLMDLSPEIARNRIADTAEEAEAHYRVRNELGRAIDLIETYALPHVPEMATPRLLGLWRDLGWRFLQRGEFQEARSVLARGELLQAGSMRREFLYCEYFERSAGLPPEDHAGQFQLAEWCLEAELLEEARKAYQAAAGSEALRPFAQTRLAVVENALRELELERLMDLYDAGQFVKAIEGLAEFRRQPLPEGFRRQAIQLENLAKDALKIAVAERPQQAEALWQQAQREFFTGSPAQALELMRTVMEQYADTPASARARQFYEAIQPRLALESIERRGLRTSARPGRSRVNLDYVPGSALADEIRRLRSSAEP